MVILEALVWLVVGHFFCEMLIVLLCCMGNVLLVPYVRSKSNANFSMAFLVS